MSRSDERHQEKVAARGRKRDREQMKDALRVERDRALAEEAREFQKAYRQIHDRYEKRKRAVWAEFRAGMASLDEKEAKAA